MWKLRVSGVLACNHVNTITTRIAFRRQNVFQGKTVGHCKSVLMMTQNNVTWNINASVRVFNVRKLSKDMRWNLPRDLAINTTNVTMIPIVLKEKIAVD
mmetsp:Transcript_7721/g.16061  ORF Transcript_7721/g.16061 Transcript_7721/m.16061 type:complete len:99 (+) Transcript_7721:1054-1350(+)